MVLLLSGMKKQAGEVYRDGIVAREGSLHSLDQHLAAHPVPRMPDQQLRVPYILPAEAVEKVPCLRRKLTVAEGDDALQPAQVQIRHSAADCLPPDYQKTDMAAVTFQPGSV